MNISEITTQESQNFIEQHLSDVVHEILLQAKKYKDYNVPVLVRQIESKNKARNKLPLWFHTKGIVYPEKLSMEQCSSETTARFKAEIYKGPAKRLIDLTGGFGVDSYFFAKTFEEVIYIERNEELNELATYNFKKLKAPNIISRSMEAEDFISAYQEKADLIYLDPARRKEGNKVFKFSDCTPDVTKILPRLFEISEHVLIKASPLADIDHCIKELGPVEQVVVLAVDNECKELLFLLNKSYQGEKTEISAVNLSQKGQEMFEFIKEEEAIAETETALPLSFIYEPNAAIMKAGAFKSVARRWSLKKLHPNSHLYTNETLIENFPGRTFRLESVIKYSKKEILEQLPEGKANITARNFPDSVDQIRKKTGVKDGGDIYLFATTDKNGKHVVLKTNKII